MARGSGGGERGSQKVKRSERLKAARRFCTDLVSFSRNFCTSNPAKPLSCCAPNARLQSREPNLKGLPLTFHLSESPHQQGHGARPCDSEVLFRGPPGTFSAPTHWSNQPLSSNLPLSRELPQWPWRRPGTHVLAGLKASCSDNGAMKPRTPVSFYSQLCECTFPQVPVNNEYCFYF